MPTPSSLKQAFLIACLASFSVFFGEQASAQAPIKDALTISEQGKRLQQVLDGSEVESRWQAGVHVEWESGLPDGKPLKGDGKHTHCSAFAASMAKQLGIYLLRPPEHSAKLLANAQFDWLSTRAQPLNELNLSRLKNQEDLWISFDDGLQAQHYANQAYLVVAVYRNHHDDKPGHIAIVRPAAKTMSEIEQEGPQITQAGGHNFFSTTLKAGFASHPAAWNKKEVRYFMHALVWK